MKAGFIGLGAMGAPMARNLAKAGFLKGVWNRHAERAAELAQELGLFHARDPAELAEHADVIITSVSADKDVLEVVYALLSGLSEGKAVVDTSTISSETAQQAGQIVIERGAHFLDAPVSGGVEGAQNGTLAMMVGGAPAALAKVRPLLQAMAGRIVHMGPIGAGQATKAVNQIMAAGINQAVSEALAFGAAQGLDMTKVIEAVSGGAAGNWFLGHRGPTMVQGVFKPGFKLALHYKDLKICQAMAQQLGIPLPITQMTLQDYEKLLQDGHGDEDISALYRLKIIPCLDGCFNRCYF